MIRKTLSIKQPWLSAILQLGKDVENRTWATSYRGPVLLHASAGLDRHARDFILDLGLLPAAEPIIRAILGVADLTGICTTARDGSACGCGPWAVPGQAHWRLSNVRAFRRAVPAKGALGLWAPTGDVAAAVDRELAHA